MRSCSRRRAGAAVARNARSPQWASLSAMPLIRFDTAVAACSIRVRRRLAPTMGLPTTSSGKLSRARTKANYLAGLYAPKTAAA